MRRITIINQPITLLAAEQTILDAALAADVPYPHGCRSGSCGTCKARLLEGKVRMQPCDTAALSEAEAAQGLILACRANPRSDVVIECLGEWQDMLPPVRSLRARVVALDQVARLVSRVRLEVEGTPLVFLAGQYAELSFDGRSARSYSMANPPDDPILEFHVRHFGGVASGYVARTADPCLLRCARRARPVRYGRAEVAGAAAARFSHHACVVKAGSADRPRDRPRARGASAGFGQPCRL
jgi:ferredoxin